MKHLFLTILAGASIAAQAQRAKIVAHITDWGADCDRVVVTARSFSSNEVVVTDTVPCKKGRFSFALRSDELSRVTFYPIFKPSPDGSFRAMPMGGDQILLFPNDEVSVKGPWDNYRMDGSPFYKDLNRVEANFAHLTAKCDSIVKVSMTMDGNDKAAVKELSAEYAAAKRALDDAQLAYIRRNPSSPVSAFLLYARVDVNSRDESVFSILQGEARHGVFGKVLDAQERAYRERKLKEKAAASVVATKPAPDFTLKRADGTDFALSSLRGKYVVLDFWGSWCGWCIKGFPEMKAYYDRYKSKVEFVGIDCGDTKEKWLKALSDYELPWVNVMNGSGDNDVTVRYAVNGYPTKVIIDEEGKIVKTVLGESPEFYQTLDALLGK